MDSRKPQSEHPVNQKWLQEVYRTIAAAMPGRLVQGVFGEASFSLTIRDGLIQSLTETHTTAHRQTAAADIR